MSENTPSRQQYVRVQRRRGVRFMPWLLLGAALGFCGGVALSMLGESEPRYTDATQAGYMGMMGLLLGLMVAGALAALVDVLLLRRSR